MIKKSDREKTPMDSKTLELELLKGGFVAYLCDPNLRTLRTPESRKKPIHRFLSKIQPEAQPEEEPPVEEKEYLAADLHAPRKRDFVREEVRETPDIEATQVETQEEEEVREPQELPMFQVEARLRALAGEEAPVAEVKPKEAPEPESAIPRFLRETPAPAVEEESPSPEVEEESATAVEEDAPVMEESAPVTEKIASAPATEESPPAEETPAADAPSSIRSNSSTQYLLCRKCGTIINVLNAERDARCCRLLMVPLDEAAGEAGI